MADYIISERTPLLLSLSLSPSLFLPPRAPSLLKNVHIVTRSKKKKRGVWLHVSYIVTCLFLFSLWPPTSPPLFFPLSLALSFSIPLTLPSPSSPDQSRIRQTCLVSLSLARSHATTLAFCIADPDTNLSNMATLYSPEPPPLCFKKKKKIFWSSSSRVGHALVYILVCVWACACVWVLGRDWEREREWVREGGWENLPQPCPDLHQIVLLKKLTTCGGDGNRSGYAKPRFHL